MAIFFLGRVTERTARGYSVEANPKCIRDVTSVLGLEEAKLVTAPSVKRTPTTESLVELEGERRAMHRTVVGNCCTCARNEQTAGDSTKDHVSDRE